MVFNMLFARAIESEAIYFVMVHADIAPEHFFVDKLVEELEFAGADAFLWSLRSRTPED